MQTHSRSDFLSVPSPFSHRGGPQDLRRDRYRRLALVSLLRVALATGSVSLCLLGHPIASAVAPLTRSPMSAHSAAQATGRTPGSSSDENARQDEGDWYVNLIGPIDPPRGVLDDLEWQGNVAVLELTIETMESAGEDDLGPYRLIEYESDCAGTLYVSASTLTIGGAADPWLRLVDLHGTTLAEDDDSGGGNAALVEYKFENREYLEIHVGVWQTRSTCVGGLQGIRRE